MRGGASAGGGNERNAGLGEFPGGRGWEAGGRALLGCHRAPPHPAALPALLLHQGRQGAARSPAWERHSLEGSRATPSPGAR